MATRWKIEFEARSPEYPDGETWRVGIAPGLFSALTKNSHDVKLARILLIEAVLEETWAVFQGWSRPDTDTCFVYVGKPKSDYRGIRIETPSPPGMLFVVFVLPDGTIDDWNWRKASEAEPDRPEGIVGRLLWRRI